MSTEVTTLGSASAFKIYVIIKEIVKGSAQVHCKLNLMHILVRLLFKKPDRLVNKIVQ